MALKIQIRNYTAADKNFILSTMLKGLYHGSYPLNLTPRPEFFEHFGQQLEAALDNAFVYVKIACDADDPDLILGYLITTARTGALVWAYTKNNFRRQGVLTQLAAQQEFPHCLHLTEIGNIIRERKGILFKPWAN